MEKMLDNIIRFVEINLEIVKLDVKESTSKAIVEVIKLLVGGFLVGVALLFASIALAFYLSGLLGGHVWGFGLVALLYLALFGGFLAAQQKLKSYFREQLEKQIPENTKLISELHNHEKQLPGTT